MIRVMALTKNLRKFLLLLPAGLMLFAQPSQVSAATEPAQWAPKDTLVFVEIPAFKVFWEKTKQLPTYRLMTDEKTKSGYEKVFKNLDKALNDYAKKLGLENVDQLKVEPQGGCAFIVTATAATEPGSEPTPHLALVGEWGENQPKIQELLDKVTATAVERGGKKETEEFKGIQITTLELVEPPAPATEGSNDNATDDMPEFESDSGTGMPTTPQEMVVQALSDIPLPESISYATNSTTTIIGSDAAAVKEALRRVLGDQEDSLASNEDYQALARLCAPVGEASLFVNLPQIMTMAAVSDDDKKEMKALGFDSLRALVVTFSLAPKPGVSSEMRGFLPITGDRRGIVKMVTDNVISKPVAPEATIPDSALACGWFNMRLETILDEVYSIMKEINPEDAEMMKANLKMTTPEGEIIDMESVFKSFAAPFMGYLAMSPPYERDNISFLLSVGHSSRDTVGKIFTFIGPYFQKRELMGQSIYDFSMIPVGVSLALTENRLALGNTPGVEGLIRSGGASAGTSLANDAQFKQTARHAPTEAWAVIYLDKMKSLEAVKAIKAKKKADEAAAAANDNANVEAPSFDFDMTKSMIDAMIEDPMMDVVDLDALRPYMSSTIVTISTTPKGIAIYGNEVEPGAK
ncbi:MAG: hypothetical protein HJJLKODD_01467 [Phycisphaerae bacterium]|nr:hypothetical protein [Phycisphaerae bacterium]